MGGRGPKDPVRHSPNRVAGRAIERAADDPADNRHELGQVHDALLSELGQQSEPQLLVDFDQHLPGERLQRLNRDLLPRHKRRVLRHVLESVAEHAQQDCSAYAIILGVVAVDLGYRRHHRSLNRQGGGERARDRHGQRQEAPEAGHEPGCCVLGRCPPDQCPYTSGVALVGSASVFASQVRSGRQWSDSVQRMVQDLVQGPLEQVKSVPSQCGGIRACHPAEPGVGERPFTIRDA